MKLNPPLVMKVQVLGIFVVLLYKLTNMISKDTIKFLKDLKKNNNRDWFNDNKPRYQAAHEEFIEFVDSLIAEIVKFDPSIGHHKAKDCVFRIYRDVRFSKNKDPYKTNMGAHITSAAKRSDIHTRAGYYIHIEPGASMMGGGAYMPKGEWLKAIREEIAWEPDELKKILNSKEFIEYFGEMQGEQLKRAPKDYPIDHPQIELLRYKSFLAMHHLDDKTITSKGFLKHAVAVSKALYPFDQWLNKSAEPVD